MNPGGIPKAQAMAQAIAPPQLAAPGPADPAIPESQPASPLEGVQGGIETPTGADNAPPGAPIDPASVPQQ